MGELKPHLGELLAAAHSEISSNVRQLDVDGGLPKAFTQEEANDFFKTFGTIESLVLTDSDPDNPDSTPKACVVYSASEEAFCAKGELQGANFFGVEIVSSVCPVGQGKDDNKKAQRSSKASSGHNNQRWGDFRVPNG